MTHEELVQSLREYERTQFEKGDELLAYAPMGTDQASNGSTAILEELSDETGISYARLHMWRHVASRILVVKRLTTVSWSVHMEVAMEDNADERWRLLDYIQNPNPNRPDGRWTVRSVRLLRGLVFKQEVEAALPTINTADDSKITQFMALAADPDVQAVATQHGPVRAAVASLVLQASQADTLHREREYSKDTVSQHLDSRRALLDLERALRTFVAAVDQLWPFLKGLPQADTDPTATRIFLDENLEDAELRVQRIRRFLETGETSLDRVLSEILHEGA